MPKMPTYIIIQNVSIDNLQVEINRMIDEGYTPLGRPFMDRANHNYCQSMSKKSLYQKAK